MKKVAPMDTTALLLSRLQFAFRDDPSSADTPLGLERHVLFVFSVVGVAAFAGLALAVVRRGGRPKLPVHMGGRYELSASD
jgi:hypothetical protein